MSRMCAMRSAVSKRTSGSNPASRHSCSAHSREPCPAARAPTAWRMPRRVLLDRARPRDASPPAALLDRRDAAAARAGWRRRRGARGRGRRGARGCARGTARRSRGRSRAPTTSKRPTSGSRSVTSTRRSGCSPRSRVSACGTIACAADWNTAMRTVPPTAVSERATSDSASSRRSSTARAWPDEELGLRA